MNMRLTKYVQSAFTIEDSEGGMHVFDFGSEMSPDVVRRFAGATSVFVSHKHPDHLHPDHVRALASATFAPSDVVVDLEKSDVQASKIMPGDTVARGHIRVTAVHSDHGPNISAPIDNVGFLITSGVARLLFLGDMAVHTPIPPGPYDAMLVPVGGSKVFTPEDAARFIERIEYKGIVIPIHYHGRADRTAGAKFKALADRQADIRVLEVGDYIDL